MKRNVPCMLVMLLWGLCQASLPLYAQLQEMAQPFSRQEIQHFFVSDVGNSVRTQTWLKLYHGKPVHWSGTVYAIRRSPQSLRTEVLIRVLPDTMLYDTVAIIEGSGPLDSRIQKDQPVHLRGKVVNGVDAIGVKEVHVLLPEAAAIGAESFQPVLYQARGGLLKKFF